jgi:hypothetical protein
MRTRPPDLRRPSSPVARPFVCRRLTTAVPSPLVAIVVEASATLLSRLGTHDKPGALGLAPGH